MLQGALQNDEYWTKIKIKRIHSRLNRLWDVFCGLTFLIFAVKSLECGLSLRRFALKSVQFVIIFKKESKLNNFVASKICTIQALE